MPTLPISGSENPKLAETFPKAEVTKEPGCVQFEVFQSVVNPDKLAILEHWTDQKALEAHARLQSARPPLRHEVRAGNTEREDYGKAGHADPDLARN